PPVSSILEAKLALSFKFSARAAPTENFLCLRNEPELLKQHQRSHQYPIFNNFSVRNSMNRNYRDTHLPSSRTDSHPRTQMRTAHRAMAHDSVPRGDHLYQNKLKVRESSQPCSCFPFD